MVPSVSYHLPSHPDTIRWGTLPLGSDAPVAVVESGDILQIDTISHEGILEDQGKDPGLFFRAQGVPAEDILEDAIRITEDVDHPSGSGPHVITGPVRVKGCNPGDYLAVDVLRLFPRVPYGLISNRDGKGVLAGSFPKDGRTVSIFARETLIDGISYGVMRRRGADAIDSYLAMLTGSNPTQMPDVTDSDVVVFPLHPFLGIMGVTPPGDVRLSTIPPGDFGGNIDIRLLVEGTRVYFPAFIDGAGFYVGDPHFSQGNGEVALTAFEASLSAILKVTVIPRNRFRAECGDQCGPLVETPNSIILTGRGLHLDEAVQSCTQQAINLLTVMGNMDERHAYAYLSAAVDFDISEAVDIQQGVHGIIPKRDFGLQGGLFKS